MYRAQVIVQDASYGYGQSFMFESPGRKTWHPKRVHWDEDRTYKTTQSAAMMVSRWLNESETADLKPIEGPYMDAHGFTVRVYRLPYSGQTVMVRSRITETKD